jgi:hypothetical protein
MSKQIGRLNDCSLGEVYHDAVKSFLTGSIRVDAETNRGRETLVLSVRQGRVLQVDSSSRDERWRLGRLLVDGDLVGQGDIDRALERAKAERRPLGAVLVEEGRIDKALLEEILHLQYKEDLHRSVVWQNGEYKVQPKEVARRELGAQPLSLNNIVQTGVWQRQEWSTIRVLVPTNESTFDKAVRGAIGADVAEKGQLGNQELRVFSLVHRSRTVRDLVPLARLESFEVCRSLALLAHAGVVTLHSGGVAPGAAKEKKKLTHGAVGHVATAFLILLALGIGLLTWMTSAPPEGESARAVSTLDPWREALTKSQMGRIQNALGVYLARHGDYPPRLGLLCEDGILEEADLTYPGFEKQYTYRSFEDRYLLVRPKH